MQKTRVHDVARKLAAMVAALALAACATTSGPRPAVLDEARVALDKARASPAVTSYATADLASANQAWQQAEAAFRKQGDTAEVRSLAYLARERATIARANGERIAAQQASAVANAERERARIAAETARAQAQSEQSEAAAREAKLAEERAEAARQAAQDAQASAALAQQQASAAPAPSLAVPVPSYRNENFDVVMRDLVATRSDRGIVVTMNDVLFDTDAATLRPGGIRLLARIGALLREHPDRVVAIEGFGDGADGAQAKALSEARAAAVREALVDAGVSTSRIVSRGYGNAFPIASNDNAEGRTRNRRVEIVIATGREVSPRIAQAVKRAP